MCQFRTRHKPMENQAKTPDSDVDHSLITESMPADGASVGPADGEPPSEPTVCPRCGLEITPRDGGACPVCGKALPGNKLAFKHGRRSRRKPEPAGDEADLE